VKDIFPDLGDGFVEACLDYFDSKPEPVLNALLENSIPEALKSVERSLPRP
jgi:activating signal cointegrator complex subunit 2